MSLIAFATVRETHFNCENLIPTYIFRPTNVLNFITVLNYIFSSKHFIDIFKENRDKGSNWAKDFTHVSVSCLILWFIRKNELREFCDKHKQSVQTVISYPNHKKADITLSVFQHDTVVYTGSIHSTLP